MIGGLQPDRQRLPDRGGQVELHLGQQVGQLQPERPADRGEDLRGRLLAAALDLGQVRHRHLGQLGELTQGDSPLVPQPAEHVPDHLA